MALRSRTRTATPTSGPGRGPSSDGRDGHRRRHPRSRALRREASAEALRLRAEALFTTRPVERRELGHGPPRVDHAARDADEPAVGLTVARVAARAASRTGAELHEDADLLEEAELYEEAGLHEGTGLQGSAAPKKRADLRAGAVRQEDATSDVPERAAWRHRAGLAVRERLPLWLQPRCGLERRSLVALTVVLVVAAVLAVQHFWTGRTQSVRAPEVVRAAAPYGDEEGRSGQEGETGTSPDASTGAPAPVGAAGSGIVVDVGGKVRSPGLQRLPAGSRVEDALRAAGGVRPGTDTDALNRARLLVDGEQIVVGGPAPVTGPGTGGSGPAGAGGSVAGAAPSAPVALNTATVEQLDGLPGVGPVLARHIIDYRTQHGGFRSVDELREVNGIGDRRFADLRNLVRP
ncbi:DNA-binding protein [Streptomyces sp. Tue6028]|uniref:ComEA family DNA-binding protein n=1 Tax=Streptomyces sp. Tue6028 TaxID=2036037 RepID=UPI000BB30B70|nr:ComEA family DNA-binding protein [Streptomyces sp. Tue6028]PBC63828.1 DNA-binding protein [Streptomyces sp. Tue6028]